MIAAAGLTWDDLHGLRGPRADIATYDYKDEAGTLLYQVVRFAPKRFRQRRPDGAGGWSWRLGDVRRVLYRLPELLGHSVVYIVEGEKDADRLGGLSLTATCNAGGAGKWREEYTRQLVGAGVRHVVILPDNDGPGRKHAQAVARACQSAALCAQVIALPDVPPKGDVSDWLDAGHTEAELIALAAEAEERSLKSCGPTPPAATVVVSDSGRRSQADRLVELTLDTGAELWHTPAGDTYITVSIENHREHHPLGGRGIKDYLARLYHRRTSRTPNARSIGDALGTLVGKARFEGAEHNVSVRLGCSEGRVYLDLGDPSWRAVEITPTGWQCIAEPPVRFRRGRALLPLPEPTHGESIDGLRDLIHVTAEDDWRLLMAWLVGAFRPVGPHPVLALDGEQGAGKSTTARILRRLVDPSFAELRAEPRDIRDLMIAASGGWVLALDNLSHVQPWLSDALCRLSTGGAISTRQLYTDEDEHIVEAIRPVILTGITSVITRGDLQDRAIPITLPAIADDQRHPEADLWARFVRVRRGVLGALLDAVAYALRNEHDVKLVSFPRMADWARWTTAGEPAMGFPAGAVVDAYIRARQHLTESALDGDPLAAAIRALARPWEGTSAELLTRITPLGRLPRGWPESPRGLAGALRRLAPQLRRVGIALDFGRRRAHSGQRLIGIADMPKRASPPPPPSPGPEALGVSLGSCSSLPSQIVTGVSPVLSLTSTRGEDGDGGDDCIPENSQQDADVYRV